jgi:hypothetical protein
LLELNEENLTGSSAKFIEGKDYIAEKYDFDFMSGNNLLFFKSLL